jgi:hypothetical protein
MMIAEEQAEYLGGEMADTRVIIRRCDICGTDRVLVQNVLSAAPGSADWRTAVFPDKKRICKCDGGNSQPFDADDIAALKAQSIDVGD